MNYSKTRKITVSRPAEISQEKWKRLQRQMYEFEYNNTDKHYCDKNTIIITTKKIKGELFFYNSKAVEFLLAFLWTLKIDYKTEFSNEVEE